MAVVIWRYKHKTMKGFKMKTSTKILSAIAIALLIAAFITMYRPLGYIAAGFAVFVGVLCKDIRKEF